MSGVTSPGGGGTSRPRSILGLTPTLDDAFKFQSPTTPQGICCDDMHGTKS